MTDVPGFAPAQCWNIFARELVVILARRNLRLGHLNDRKDEQGPLVHPEKVRRLQRSLSIPKSLTTLNPEELQRVTRAFELTAEEQTRLRAALLATAIEMLLMGRVAIHMALLAADEAFRALLPAMQQSPALPGMSGVRDPALPDAYGTTRVTEYPQLLAQAIDAVDRATLALHLSDDEVSIAERIDHAAEAQMGYSRALEILEQPPLAETDPESWTYWRDQAISWKAVASQRLLTLLAEVHGLASE